VADVLDHGYVDLIESWGSDVRIVEAARMSTGKGFKGWGTPDCPGDEKLLRYLWEHKHTSPFEMAGATFEVQAPIFVFREWMRHRTQSYNEMSGRYAVLPDLYYIPSTERLMAAKQDTKNKQGSVEGFTEEEVASFQGAMSGVYSNSRQVYNSLLAVGVAKEVARMVLPVSQYSRMRASANLLNWLKFLRLRLPKNAQHEIRQYALVILNMLAEKFPHTIELFMEEDNWTN
jgi:thymidylate synthase (FAD)